MKEHIQMRQIPYLDIWSMLLSGQISHRGNSSHLFWNLKDSVLVQTLSYRRKITYHLLLIGFFQKLISMQDVGHMLHLHVAQQLPSLYLHQWIISPTIDNDAGLNRQFPFDIDLNKILPDLLKLRTKAEKPAIQFSQHTYVNGKRKNSLETRVVMLISLLELEISGVAVQSIIHQNSKKKDEFSEELLSENDFNSFLAIFCCYDHGAKASAAVQKEYRKCSLCIMICWIAKVYLSINNSENGWLQGYLRGS